MEDVIGTSQIMTKIVMAIGAERGKLFELNPDGTGRLCICTQLPSLKPDGIGRLELI